MMDREEITLGVYLRQTAGDRPGIIAVVHRVGTSLSGEWFFQLRYLGCPAGTRKRSGSEWSVNLREIDLAYFDLIGPWISAQALLASRPPSSKRKKEPALLAWRRGTPHPDQLRMFEDC
ncbi:MAG: hypothetical protein E8D52_14105 [Nitrospira sp.]|nr:MAG: hypothetical protein E8D52_14105 [Nitrospira sp.]